MVCAVFEVSRLTMTISLGLMLVHGAEQRWNVHVPPATVLALLTPPLSSHDSQLTHLHCSPQRIHRDPSLPMFGLSFLDHTVI